VADGATLPPCSNGDCSKRLLGDWTTLGPGDCIDVRLDPSGTYVTKLACTAPHLAEVYLVQVPDPGADGPQAGESALAFRLRVCPSDAIATYAPRYAAGHPGAAASRSRTWSDGTKRVCALIPDVASHPIGS